MGYSTKCVRIVDGKILVIKLFLNRNTIKSSLDPLKKLIFLRLNMFIYNVSSHVIHAVPLTAMCRTFVVCESSAEDPARRGGGLGGSGSSRASSSSADTPASPPFQHYSCTASAQIARSPIRTIGYPSTTSWRFSLGFIRLAFSTFLSVYGTPIPQLY